MSFKSKVNPVLFIAEVGSNHEGDFSEAKRLVINASKTNSDVVKLQIFNPENMVSKKYDPRRYDHFKKLEIMSEEIEPWFKKQREINPRASFVINYAGLYNEEQEIISMRNNYWENVPDNLIENYRIPTAEQYDGWGQYQDQKIFKAYKKELII